MMLVDLLSQHPQALGAIVRSTPSGVWGLLAGLVALGASQMRERTASRLRVLAMPAAMTAFSAYGVMSAFGGAGNAAWAVGCWAAAAVLAACLLVVIAPRAPQHTRFDAASGQFHLPASVAPLLLILAVFLTKYAVGIELALRPQAASSLGFTLPVCLMYGLFNGLFVARALRLQLLAQSTPTAAPMAAPAMSLQ